MDTYNNGAEQTRQHDFTKARGHAPEVAVRPAAPQPHEQDSWGIIRYAPGSGHVPDEDVAAFDGWYADYDEALAIAKEWAAQYPQWVVGFVQSDSVWFGNGDFAAVADKPLTQREVDLANAVWQSAKASSSSSSQSSPSSNWHSMSADELTAQTFAPVKYVVPGYIVEGLTLFGGKPKLGKSWLLLHAAIAVARGEFTLGEVKCPEGDVLYCALEDNWRRLQSRLKKLLGNEPAPKRLTLMTELPRLNDGGLDVLRTWLGCDAEKPRLIVIDVLARVRDPAKKNQQPYEADYQAMQGLKQIADTYGIAVVVVHHMRKLEAEDPLDQISGTTGLAGSADSVLVLHRTGSGTVLAGRGRDLEEFCHAAVFNKNSCTWTVLGEASEIAQKTGRGAILFTLKEAKAPMSPQEIADLCKMTKPNVRQLLTRMEKDGEVLKVRYGRYVHSERDDLL